MASSAPPLITEIMSMLVVIPCISSEWCSEHFLQHKALLKVREIRSQLLEIMTKTNMAEVSCGINSDVVRIAICSAFFHHAARMKGGTVITCI